MQTLPRTLLLLLMLTGCTTIDKQVVGWPSGIKVVKHEVSFWDVQKKCWEHMPIAYKLLGGVAMACAYVNLDTLTCDVYHMPSPSKADVDHEVSHCNGGDHDGILQRYFDAWRGRHHVGE